MWGGETQRRQAWLAGEWKEEKAALAGMEHGLFVGCSRELLQVFDQQSDRVELNSLDGI